VRFLVDKVALGEVLVRNVFPLSVSCQQCPTLIFFYMLHLPDGQTGADGERYKKAMRLRTLVVHWV